jgi:hypothetical protein
VNAEVARETLDDFADGPWGRKYPAIAPAWRRQWEQVIPFFAYPPEVRRIIYTTDALDKRDLIGSSVLPGCYRAFTPALSLGGRVRTGFGFSDHALTNRA